MKLTPDQLAQRLAAELGLDAVSLDADRLATHKIDDKQPVLVCTPGTRDQVSAALRLCADAAASVIPWGGGTAMALGNPPRRVDVVLNTGRLNGVIEHDHANLTVTVESGISLTALQQRLADQRQFGPFDPPFPERSSVGGIVAANLNGPRRGCYGSVRDLVIGIGSLGTLGIITELTLRLVPLPESVSTVVAAGTFSQAEQFIRELFRSRLLPTAVILSNERAHEPWSVAIRSEGFEESVARCRRDLDTLAVQAGMSAQLLSAGEHEELWRAVRDFPLQDKRLIYRITLPRAEICDFLHRAQNWPDTETTTDNVNGTIWLACAPTKASVQRFSDLATLARARRGHAMIFAAPGDLKQGFEVWGDSPPAFSLMRDVKHQFDPRGLLNPGRFVGSL
ncbi:MAG: FAD-binding oxidoreductase [Deltaproteobacteria bacterium]|nr:MAG: FAD-binding oxidoreductase [Deltaproteobacteria bacterium]